MRVHVFRGCRVAALWAVLAALALLVPASLPPASMTALLNNADARSAPARSAENLPARQPNAEAGSLDPPVLDALAGQTAAPEALRDPCQEPPEPLAPGSFRFAFRAPLPAAPLWNPPGPKRVGLQAGHWLNEERPTELVRLQHGTSGGGRHEWEVNLAIAKRAARYLEAAGVEVNTPT